MDTKSSNLNVLDQLYVWKNYGRDICGVATAELSNDIETFDFSIKALNVFKKGTKVLIWTVSRFGCISITDDFKRKGYKARVFPNDLINYNIIKIPEKGWKER